VLMLMAINRISVLKIAGQQIIWIGFIVEKSPLASNASLFFVFLFLYFNVAAFIPVVIYLFDSAFVFLSSL